MYCGDNWNRRILMENYLAKNLFRLRISFGFKQEEVAVQLGITRPNYIHLEKGKSFPKESTLQSIAKLYKVTPESLLAKPKEYPNIRFRSKSLKSERQKNQRESLIQIFLNHLEDYIDLENILNNHTKFQFVNFPVMNPKDTAFRLRQELGLGEVEPIQDISGLIQKIGIRVILLPPLLKEFFGLSARLSEKSMAIGINNDHKISIERRIFTIAHELAHILLHSNSFKPEEEIEIGKEENEADEFASYFLLPEKGFWKEWHKREGISFVDKVLQIKRIYKVSYKTVLKRLESNFEKKGVSPFVIFNKNYKGKIISHQEPEGLTEYDFAEEKFPSLVREAFLKEEISFSRGAELLNLSNKEMRELASEWSLDSSLS